MSSMYQLQGISTSVLAVRGAGGGSGCIHDEAGTDGEKSIGWGVVLDSRKYGEESWWVKEVSRRG